MADKIAVLIPCYNEAITIGKVVDDFKRVLPEADIYVYDNNSKDDTAKIAHEHGAILKVVKEKAMLFAACFVILRLTTTSWLMAMIPILQKQHLSC